MLQFIKTYKLNYTIPLAIVLFLINDLVLGKQVAVTSTISFFMIWYLLQFTINPNAFKIKENKE